MLSIVADSRAKEALLKVGILRAKSPLQTCKMILLFVGTEA
jgi:hypothetical protein